MGVLGKAVDDFGKLLFKEKDNSFEVPPKKFIRVGERS